MEHAQFVTGPIPLSNGSNITWRRRRGWHGEPPFQIGGNQSRAGIRNQTKPSPGITLIITIIKKANIRFWYITVMVKQPVSIWPWVVTLFRTSLKTSCKTPGSFMEPEGSLMQVWGDTGTGGSKILWFQIPRTRGYVFSNLHLHLVLGNEALKM